MADKAPKNLWQYAAVYHGKDGDEVAVEPTQVLARDADHAKLLAIRALPEKYDEKLDELEIIVKPFR